MGVGGEGLEEGIGAVRPWPPLRKTHCNRFNMRAVPFYPAKSPRPSASFSISTSTLSNQPVIVK